jgi:hypothetical protein
VCHIITGAKNNQWLFLTLSDYVNTSSDPKKGALDFKNPKLKKYSDNLIKLN